MRMTAMKALLVVALMAQCLMFMTEQSPLLHTFLSAAIFNTITKVMVLAALLMPMYGKFYQASLTHEIIMTSIEPYMIWLEALVVSMTVAVFLNLLVARQLSDFGRLMLVKMKML